MTAEQSRLDGQVGEMSVWPLEVQSKRFSKQRESKLWQLNKEWKYSLVRPLAAERGEYLDVDL